MIENHSKPLMFHMWLWVKDEPGPFSYSYTMFIVKDLKVINHFIHYSPHFSGLTVLFTEHIVSTEDTTLNEFLLGI